MAFNYATYNADEDKKYQDYLSRLNTAINSETESEKSKAIRAERDSVMNAGYDYGNNAEWNKWNDKLTALGDYTDANGYGDKTKQYMSSYENWAKTPFNYDVNGDALYQQYKDQYMSQGKLAMQDTIAKASAMTGGYGNSYAATAGNQAYQSYLGKLNDVVPQLYQLALDRHNAEGENLSNLAGMYNTMSQQDRDNYNTDFSRYSGMRESAGQDVKDLYNTRVSTLSSDLATQLGLDDSQKQMLVSYLSNAAENERTFNSAQVDKKNEYDYANYQEALKAASSSGSSGSGRSGSSSSSSSGVTVGNASVDDLVNYANLIIRDYGEAAAQDEINRLKTEGQITTAQATAIKDTLKWTTSSNSPKAGTSTKKANSGGGKF